MSFVKVTISLPKNLHEYAKELVQKGLFSNFSDLVRSGIRKELNEMEDLSDEFDEKYIYNDKKLIAGVKQSMKDIREGKSITFKTDKEFMDYFSDHENRTVKRNKKKIKKNK
jgi:Arc/MetJ-type ribon-helix-helix transcriptional regulator